MQRLAFIFFLLSSNMIFAQKQVFKVATPNWVNNQNFSEENITKDNGGSQYLLIDYQDNFITCDSYKHFVIKLFNLSGIQSNSDISVAFDPSYQKLYFHKINIIRNGKSIDKLNLKDFQIIQRESSLDRALYDGSLTAILNLTDVREGDVIEYSYTIHGFNPIYDRNFSNTFYQQFSIPISRVYNRLITHSNGFFEYKLFNGAKEPEIKTNAASKEYIWNIEAFDFKLYESNTPPWTDIYKRVSFSNTKEWSQIVNWALPLYKYNSKSISKVVATIEKRTDKKDAAVDLIRFVQNNIRYLGFEEGINAYKPHSPDKIFSQRFGDCKDKSLLLVSLLREIGIEAYPLLVNTYLSGEILNELPAINLFNHCIVNFRIDEKDYFIDPTISNQGGDIDNIYIPNYAYGLPIKEGQTELKLIPHSPKSIVTIDEVVTLDSIGGNAIFNVSTKYTYGKADDIRSYFNSTSVEAIKKEYTDFYRNLYPRIEAAKNIQIIDSTENKTDKLIVCEDYFINKIWEKSAGASGIYCDIYPLVLETYTDYYQSDNREIPYYLGEPFSYSQTTVVNLPEKWYCKEDSITITGNGFKYENKITCSENKITVVHKFDLFKNAISGDSIQSFLDKIEKVKNEMHYYLTYNSEGAKFKLSWISVLVALLTIVISMFFYTKLYKNYNPLPKQQDTNRQIGGWMILPLIGLLLSPILLSSQLFTEDFFNHNTWTRIYNGEVSISRNVLFLIAGEIIYNFALLTFNIFLIILFFKKRSSLPNLISIYYIVLFLGTTLDLILSKMMLGELYTNVQYQDSLKLAIRAFWAAIIWIPFFHISKQVGATFCKTYESSKMNFEADEFKE